MSDTEIKTFETLWQMIWKFFYAVVEKLGWHRIGPVYDEAE